MTTADLQSRSDGRRMQSVLTIEGPANPFSPTPSRQIVLPRTPAASSYPIGISVMTLAVGLIFLRDTKGVDITTSSGVSIQKA